MKRIFIATTLSFTLAALAQASSGKTADGCTYKVINGQYLTSCDPKPKASDQVVMVASAPTAAPVTSYGSVPVRSNPDALVPSVQTMAPQTMTVNLSAPVQSSLVKEEVVEKEIFRDQTYVGATLGSTSIKEGRSSTGLGATIGSSLDEHFGIELGYNYTSQGLNLGLDTRGNSLGDSYPAREDSSLKSHLITTEFQGFATNSNRRLRPFLGLGMGVKISSLKEKSLGNNYGYYGSESPSGSLHQTSFGGIGSAGAKLRVGKGFNVGVAFRYFFPILRQESRLDQGNANYYSDSQTRLTKADEVLTGASQYQLQGGLEYLF